MDGATSLRTLRKRMRKAERGATPALIDQEIRKVYNQLHPRGYLYLASAGSYGVKLPNYSTMR
jgi:hypothetical protein